MQKLNPDINNPVLSIAVLVSNRKDTVGKCLDSLEPLRRAVPCQLILLDTGCDKDLRAELDRRGDVVADFAWRDDFSAARNETLRYATGEWYMYVDDDEWFVEIDPIIDFFKSGEYRKFGRASYIQRNFLDMEMTQYTDAWVSRMTKLTPETHFVSRIHEYIEPAEGNINGLTAIVHHFGYVYETEEALRAHYERNRKLLEEMIAEEPECLRWRIQLAQEYRAVREYDKLYALGEECLEMTRDIDDRYDNVAIGGFYASRITARREQERYSEVYDLCVEAERDRRNTELCHAYLALNHSRAAFYIGKYRESEDMANEYLRLKKFFDGNEPILYIQKPVPFVGECFDLVMQKECYSLLICSGLKQGSTKNLAKYLDLLEWDKHHVYVFEEMASTLIEAMNELPADDALARTLRVMHGQSALWDYMTGQIVAYEKSGHSVTQLMSLLKTAVPDALMTEDEVAATHQEEPQELSPEMENMAREIKGQLRALIANGMQEQALAIIKNVRQLLPEDTELQSMENELKGARSKVSHGGPA